MPAIILSEPGDKLKHVAHRLRQAEACRTLGVLSIVMASIFHITPRQEWNLAKRDGIYKTSSLAAEGFIHCSQREQVVRTANRLFSGQTGLVLLEIDTDRVKAEIRYENCEGGQELFPHIYGALDPDSVVRVLDFEPAADGDFVLPSS